MPVKKGRAGPALPFDLDAFLESAAVSQADRPLCPRRPRVRTGGRGEQRVLRPGRRREALGPVGDGKRSRRRDAGSRRFLRRRMPGRPAAPHGRRRRRLCRRTVLRIAKQEMVERSTSSRRSRIGSSRTCSRATSASKKIWSISSSTRARSGSRARCCCWRATAKQDASQPSPAEAVAGDAGRDGRHDAVARQLLHEQVPEARVHRIQRRSQDSTARSSASSCTTDRPRGRCALPNIFGGGKPVRSTQVAASRRRAGDG